MEKYFVSPVDINEDYDLFFVPDLISVDINNDLLYKGINVISNKWIELACDIAMKSVNEGGGPFGAVVIQVDDETNKIIRYWTQHNRVTKLNDPTAHAEIMAIRNVCSDLGVFHLDKIDKNESKLKQISHYSHCEIFSSCEPCPMCISAIEWAKIPILYFAATRYDASASGIGFSDLKLYDEMKKNYSDRKMKIYRSIPKNYLDSFNKWKEGTYKLY